MGAAFAILVTMPLTCPFASELERFPPAAIVWDNSRAADQYCAGLQARAAWSMRFYGGDSWAWRLALRDSAHAAYCWEKLAYASQPDARPCQRRQWLDELRVALGPGAYAAGRMPEPIPRWTTWEK
jgi:hypothetical protein